MGIENILIFSVLLLSIGEGIMGLIILRDIEHELKILTLINDKTNERLDRLINTAQATIYQISKNIDDIQKKID